MYAPPGGEDLHPSPTAREGKPGLETSSSPHGSTAAMSLRQPWLGSCLVGWLGKKEVSEKG